MLVQAGAQKDVCVQVRFSKRKKRKKQKNVLRKNSSLGFVLQLPRKHFSAVWE
jgi:hypothetical protein